MEPNRKELILATLTCETFHIEAKPPTCHRRKPTVDYVSFLSPSPVGPFIPIRSFSWIINETIWLVALDTPKAISSNEVAPFSAFSHYSSKLQVTEILPSKQESSSYLQRLISLDNKFYEYSWETRALVWMDPWVMEIETTPNQPWVSDDAHLLNSKSYQDPKKGGMVFDRSLYVYDQKLQNSTLWFCVCIKISYCLWAL